MIEGTNIKRFEETEDPKDQKAIILQLKKNEKTEINGF